MTSPTIAYTQGSGTSTINPVVSLASPPTAFIVNYPVGQIAVVPSQNAVYVMTSKSSVNGATTATWIDLISFNPGVFPVTPYVVGPIGQAGYQTIQSAIDASFASTNPGVVVVQPGTYTENLILQSDVNIMGLNFADAGGGVTIVGEHTPPTTGGFTFRNVALNSATNIFNSSAAGSAHLVIADTIINVTDGYTFNVPNWTGKLESFDVNGVIGTNDGYVNNSGGATVAIFDSSVGAIGSSRSMIISGFFIASGTSVYCPISFNSGSNVVSDGGDFNATVTFNGTGFGEISLSNFSTGTNAALTMNSTGMGRVVVSNCTINSSANPCINGSGTSSLVLGALTFVQNAIVLNTLNVSACPASIFGEVRAGADTGGAAGSTSLTSTSAISVSTGVGTVHMSSTNNLTNSGFIKIYVGTTPYWIPVWSTNSP